MMRVEEALARILAAAKPLPGEIVPLSQAAGRVLVEPVTARRTQPPSDLSAMDGWAVRAADASNVGVRLRRVGESAAGHAPLGAVGRGEAFRIFTGAAVPPGADAIVLQEDASETDDGQVVINEAAVPGRHIRRAGIDFNEGDAGPPLGRVLGPSDIALLAAMNIPWVTVARRPKVAILATGDELARPGDPLGPHMIVSSNNLGVAALVTLAGGEVVDLGIARDTPESLAKLAEGAKGADIFITLGGASVGDHDLVKSALGAQGLELDFWKIAMRPGKPLIFGRFHGSIFMGLPGNPVSALVCAELFLRPLLARLSGADTLTRPQTARLAGPLKANDQRQDFLRARLSFSEGKELVADVFPVQDSSMLSVLSAADGLVIRPPNAPAAAAGDLVEILPLRPL